MDLPKDWGRLFSALLRDLHVNNISTRVPFFGRNMNLLWHFKRIVWIPDTLDSTLAMTYDTLSHSTPDFGLVFVEIRLSLR